MSQLGGHDPNVSRVPAGLARRAGVCQTTRRGPVACPLWSASLMRLAPALPQLLSVWSSRVRGASGWLLQTLLTGWVAGALGAPVLLVGCADAMDATAAAEPAGGADASCTASSCGPGLLCHSGKWCVAASAAPEQVVVHIKPPAESGQLTEHFALLVGPGEPESHLQLTEPAVVRGSVLRQGELGVGKQWLAGTLVATAKSEVEGVTLQYSAKASAEAKLYAGSPSPQGFELRVQPGYTYQLSFWPEAADKIPPYYTEQIVGASRDDVRLELPPAQELVSVEGRLVSGGKPLVGLRVQLDDAANRQVSTRAVTDADGRFALVAGPQTDVAFLRFGPTNDVSGLPKGKLTSGCDLVKAKKSGHLLLGDVELGHVGQPVPMAVLVVGADGKPEAGATVRVQQQLPGAGLLPTLEGYTEVHGLTDAKGEFRAAMPPGPVLVQVRPALTSLSGDWQQPTELGADEQETLQVQCPKRHVLSGALVDASGKVVANTELMLRRESSQTASLLSQSAVGEQPVLARTDNAGRFAVPVDDGVWRVWVQPVDSSGAVARALAARVEMLGADSDLGTVTLPAPMVVAGQIVDASGKALVGAVVDVLSVAATAPVVETGGAKQGQAAAPALLDSYLLGSATTGPQGAFSVLITPTPQNN